MIMGAPNPYKKRSRSIIGRDDSKAVICTEQDIINSALLVCGRDYRKAADFIEPGFPHLAKLLREAVQ